MSPAVIYAAKSTEDKHGSIPTQIADCEALAKREGLDVVAEPYHDEGFLAYKGNRGPGLAKARAHAAELGAVLIVQHSDRLARGAGDAPGAAITRRRARAPRKTLLTTSPCQQSGPRYGLSGPNARPPATPRPLREERSPR
jgi:DNA invertase Pin-like site-specific DNA recombinase